MMNEQSKDVDSSTPFDAETCRARDLGIDNLVECLVKDPTCNYAISFGTGFFCDHPRRKEIAARRVPVGEP